MLIFLFIAEFTIKLLATIIGAACLVTTIFLGKKFKSLSYSVKSLTLLKNNHIEFTDGKYTIKRNVGKR